jgi:hypothetical protein
MRRGYNSELIKDDNGKLIGVNLGADYCAEHEWGIDSIKNAFGVNVDSNEKPFASWWKALFKKEKEAFGLQKRTITKSPEIVVGEATVSTRNYRVKGSRAKKHKVYFLGYKKSFWSSTPLSEYFAQKVSKEIYSISDEENVWGWWSEDDFLVASTDKEAISELEEAFKNLDLTISVGGGHVFKNGGLHFMIKSRIEAEYAQEVYNMDVDSFNLKKAAVDTGIYEKLDKANRKFYALSPRWKDDNKTEVVFWLNPEDQSNNNACWCTIQDLEDWIKGEGKIPKTKVS